MVNVLIFYIQRSLVLPPKYTPHPKVQWALTSPVLLILVYESISVELVFIRNVYFGSLLLHFCYQDRTLSPIDI